MNSEQAIELVENLQSKYYKPPSSYYDKKKIDFEFESYTYSAINEIKQYLIEHQDQNPISTLEEFRYQMDCFACDAKNGNTNFIFSVYYDVATDVLDALLASK